ncbi:MAG TPA: hypothetical protein DCZ30_07020 [Clostridiales bacterium]|nr:hypothetical protein [Clostridiales bacterium]
MMLFFLCVLIIFLVIFVVIRYSSIRISIINLEIDTDNKDIISDYQFEIGIYFFNKIRIIKLTVNEKKIKKLQDSKFIKTMCSVDFGKVTKKIEKKIQDRVIKDYKSFNILNFIKVLLKELKLEILKFNLNFKFGVSDIMVTTYTVPIISTLISFILKLTVKDINLKNKRKDYYYKIEPVYNKNIINLRLNCIINVKIVHIINIIYIFLIKKRRSDKYERTSYRRSYGYSHE